MVRLIWKNVNFDETFRWFYVILIKRSNGRCMWSYNVLFFKTHYQYNAVEKVHFSRMDFKIKSNALNDRRS